LNKILENPRFFQHEEYPSLIKYMGSKSKIIDFVLDGINEAYAGGAICDLFSGSASLAGAIGQQCAVHSNDIQAYSKVLANTYNIAYLQGDEPTDSQLYGLANEIFSRNRKAIKLSCSYREAMSLDEFNELEARQQSLINRKFRRDWHLFAKYYSGTWWSLDQCLWIDAYREVAEEYSHTPIYSVILSSLMFAMAYTSQGTGHYAQYRDAKTIASKNDILIYRKKSISTIFSRKFKQLIEQLPNEKPSLNHISTTLDFSKCLSQFEGGVVYADPPYCFVHYSRFYHALETLIKYDYPEIQTQKGRMVKGRYRNDRHQSPFCIKTKVEGAFETLFKGVNKSSSNLVLSYSNTGMISIDELESLARDILGKRKLILLTTDHQHMTLGRQKDRQREVKECLIIAKK